MPVLMVWTIGAISACFVAIFYVVQRLGEFQDDLPIVNRKHVLEPRFFSRVRWMLRSHHILLEANRMCCNTPFRLIRGDTDVIILPADYIPELNKIPVTTLNPPSGHYQTLTGHLNGLNAILETSLHVKLINSRLTPAIPSFWQPIQHRIAETLQDALPQSHCMWNELDPVEAAAICVSRAANYFIFGPPVCDDPRVIELATRISRALFETTFFGRMVPPFFQKGFMWLLPCKWTLRTAWAEVTELSLREIRERREKLDGTEAQGMLTWMLKDGNFQTTAEEVTICTSLLGSLMAGGIYSTAANIAGVLTHLALDVDAMQQLRDEIRDQNNKVAGVWNQDSFDSLVKLDAILKEAARFVPPSTLTYARRALQNFTLSSGLNIKKGQCIAVSAYPRSVDPVVFPEPEKCMPFRARAEPYRTIDNQDFRWGSGRWACPGRFIASAMIKMILVKAIDEYDFEVVGGCSPRKVFLHEFVFWHPSLRLWARRREDVSGILYG